MFRSASTFSRRFASALFILYVASVTAVDSIATDGTKTDDRFSLTTALMQMPQGSFLQPHRTQYDADFNSGKSKYGDDGPAQKSKYAFVTIFYEVGMNDAEYFLGARVALNSAKYHDSVADRVAIVTPDCQQKYIDQFVEDGVRVRVLSNNVAFNYEHLERWGNVLNKLAVWDMVEYDRVIFIDADVIITNQPDVMFKCGHFCPVYYSMARFHTGLMVIKPDHDELMRLLDGLTKHDSYDGADQGFLNSFYKKESENAKLFHPEFGVSEDKMNRLGQKYCMHALYFMPMMTWDGYTKNPKEDILAMTYPTFVHQAVKPWCWYTFPLWDIHYTWAIQRWALCDFWAEWWPYFVAFLLSPLLAAGLHILIATTQRKWVPAKLGVVTFPKIWMFHLMFSCLNVMSAMLPFFFLPAIVEKI